jgi:uncharacterized protein (TIGR02453 family)
MATRFPGFPKEMPTFFRALEKNNTREWFAPRKPIYEEKVRLPMVDLARQINDALRSFAVDNVVADPAKAIYRLYRDTRFSRDKTPYKTHIGVTYPRSGLPKHGGAGFYFSVSHKEVEIAAGVYMPGPDELNAIRAALAVDACGFLKIMEDKVLVKRMGPLLGEKLKRMPKDWEKHAESPGAEYFKFKQLYWYIKLPAKLALGPKLADAVIERFKAMRAGVEWFNSAILAARAREADKTRPVRPEPMW